MKQSTKLPRMVLCGRTEKAPSWQEQGGQRAFTVTGTSRLLTYPAKAQQKRQLLQMGIQARQRPGRQQLRAVQLRGRQSKQQHLRCEARVWQMQVDVAVQRFTACQRILWISKEEDQKKRMKPKQKAKRKWDLKELVSWEERKCLSWPRHQSLLKVGLNYLVQLLHHLQRQLLPHDTGRTTHPAKTMACENVSGGKNKVQVPSVW